MRSDIYNGIVSGLVAGVVFGIMMQMMNAPTPEGGQMSMMAMVAMVVRSGSIAIGWLYHLFNSAIVGAPLGGCLGVARTTMVRRWHGVLFTALSGGFSEH